MTWVWIFLAWVVASVLLGMLMGILLGIRRELEDVGRELNLVLHRVEDIQKGVVEIRLQTAGSWTGLLTGETEHIGTVAMETTPGKPTSSPMEARKDRRG